MTPYQELMDAVTQYYGAGSDEWLEIAKYGVSAPHLEEILSNVPGVSIVKNLNGSIRSFNFAATENITPGAETAVNSNLPPVLQTFDVPANTGIQEVTNAAGETVKQVTFKSGMEQAGNFVMGEVAPAVAAASAGITFGKGIDKLLYNINPNFWDEHGMSTLDPDTWGEIIGTDTKGGRFLNMMLRTTPDHKTQAYMDENALAYMALYLQNKGVFAKGVSETTKDEFLTNSNIASEYLSDKIQVNNVIFPDYVGFYNSSIKSIMSANIIPNAKVLITASGIGDPVFSVIYTHWNINLFIATENQSVYENLIRSEIPCFMFSNGEPTDSDSELLNKMNIIAPSTNLRHDKATLNGKTFYYVGVDEAGNDYDAKVINSNSRNIIKKSFMFESDITPYLAYYMLYGNTQVSPTIEGIGTQDGAVTPDISNAKTVAEVLKILKNTYPGLFQNAVTQNVVQPDGTIKPYTYVPVATPDIDPDGDPISSTSDQAKPEVDPKTATENLLKTITQIIQVPTPTNPPDTGKGHTPTVTPPTGSASSLYAIYNPTLSQINAFGAWLWSDNFVDQIKKLFNDPMQAIIGLHKVYATPATNGAQTIKVGYLDSGVSANVVSNQYTTIDCGTVSLPEYFHNVFDYSPYTQVNLYLPFIGIVPLDNADVMRSSIHIVYHVDVLSGACLAEVKVTRDGAGGTLYQYTGNASVTLPISSGSYMGIVSSIASIAGGIAGTIASGGAALPMIASAAGSALNARTKVEHSGGFSGNAGAMGGKIPYLIISRPQIVLADNYRHYIGKPSNFTATLGSCHGYTEVIECHLENVNATNSELDEIDALLKGGVIV